MSIKKRIPVTQGILNAVREIDPALRPQLPSREVVAEIVLGDGDYPLIEHEDPAELSVEAPAHRMERASRSIDRIDSRF